LLIAQTKHHGWDIVSKDAEFRAYGIAVIW